MPALPMSSRAPGARRTFWSRRATRRSLDGPLYDARDRPPAVARHGSHRRPRRPEADAARVSTSGRASRSRCTAATTRGCWSTCSAASRRRSINALIGADEVRDAMRRVTTRPDQYQHAARRSSAMDVAREGDDRQRDLPAAGQLALDATGLAQPHGRPGCRTGQPLLVRVGCRRRFHRRHGRIGQRPGSTISARWASTRAADTVQRQAERSAILQQAG